MAGMQDRVTLFLKGMAMGAADVVPGVSGGTVAFITNIYDELIESIHSIGPKTLITLRREGLASAWHSINGNFLLTLFLGIATSILSLAKVITHLLATQPILVWAFFFGLIVISAIFIAKQIEAWNVKTIATLIVGVIVAWHLSSLTPQVVEATPLMIVGSGALAICAMILPGISGSFILLMLGMYAPILGAIKAFDIGVVALFGSGAVIGLLSFSRLLDWLLKNVRSVTLALLTGFMVGSLNKVWPWKQTLSYRTNSQGEQVPLLQSNISPNAYAELMSTPSQLLPALGLMVLAVAIVVALERFGSRR